MFTHSSENLCKLGSKFTAKSTVLCQNYVSRSTLINHKSIKKNCLHYYRYQYIAKQSYINAKRVIDAKIRL